MVYHKVSGPKWRYRSPCTNMHWYSTGEKIQMQRMWRSISNVIKSQAAYCYSRGKHHIILISYMVLTAPFHLENDVYMQLPWLRQGDAGQLFEKTSQVPLWCKCDMQPRYLQDTYVYLYRRESMNASDVQKSSWRRINWSVTSMTFTR